MHLLLQLEMQKLLEKLSKPASYQILIYILFGFNLMPAAFHHLYPLVAAPDTPFWCMAPNGSIAAYSNESIVNNTKSDRECVHYDEVTSKAKGDCSQWRYQLDRKNVVTEFNLVCKDAWLLDLANTVYFLGVAAGGLVGLLADDFGRKLLMLVCILTNVLLAIGVYLAGNYILFVVFRTLHGVLVAGSQTCLVVLMLESLPTRLRCVAGSLFGLFWVAGFLWMTLLDYLIQNWRYLELAITLPSIFALIGIWALPESVSWMVTKFKLKQADTELTRIARFNKIFLDEKPLSTMVTPDNPNDPMTQSIEDLRGGTKLQTPRLRKHKIVMVFIWFSVWFSYFGLTYNPLPITGNRYYDVIIDICVDAPLLVLAPLAVLTFGSRNTTFISMIIASVFSIIAALIPDYAANSQNAIGWIRYPFVLISKMTTACVMFMLYRYSAEIIHTQQRAASIGGFSAAGAIGAAVAIQVHKAVIEATVGHFRLVYLIYAALLLVSALLCRFLLPDTNARNNLPETVQDAEFVGAKPAQIRRAKFKGEVSTIGDFDTEYLSDEGVLSNDNFSFGKRALGSETASEVFGYIELGHQAEVGAPGKLMDILEYGNAGYNNPAFATDDERLMSGDGRKYSRIEDVVLVERGDSNPASQARETSDESSKTSKESVKFDDSVDSGLSSSREDSGTMRSRTVEEGVGTEKSSIFEADPSDRIIFV